MKRMIILLCAMFFIVSEPCLAAEYHVDTSKSLHYHFMRYTPQQVCNAIGASIIKEGENVYHSPITIAWMNNVNIVFDQNENTWEHKYNKRIWYISWSCNTTRADFINTTYALVSAFKKISKEYIESTTREAESYNAVVYRFVNLGGVENISLRISYNPVDGWKGFMQQGSEK